MKYCPANCTKDGRKNIQSTTRLCYVLFVTSLVLAKTHSWDGAGLVGEQSTNEPSYQKTRLKNASIVWSTTSNLLSVLKAIYQDRQKGSATNTVIIQAVQHEITESGGQCSAFFCLNSMNSGGSKVAVSGGSKVAVKVGQKLPLRWVKVAE